MGVEDKNEAHSPVSYEAYQLAVAIDKFWCDINPYHEVTDGVRSEEDAMQNILYIAKDIYRGEMDTANRLQEILDNRWLSDIAEEAKQLLCRLNAVATAKVSHV